MIPTFTDHEVVSPASLNEALAFLAENKGKGWTPLAGSTDALMPLYHQGQSVSSRWLNLQRIQNELRFIKSYETGIEIGAMTTISDLLQHRDLIAFCPIIERAANWIAGVPIRNRATVAGNIVNGSPAADLPPVWLCLHGQLQLASAHGQRRIPLDEFWTGYKSNSLQPDELVVGLHLPRLKYNRFYYRKVAPRAANSISQVVFAACGYQNGNGVWENIQLAYGCMGPYPIRFKPAEQLLKGHVINDKIIEELCRMMKSELKPISDDRASAEYRMQVAVNLTREFLNGHLRYEPTYPL